MCDFFLFITHSREGRFKIHLWKMCPLNLNLFKSRKNISRTSALPQNQICKSCKCDRRSCSTWKTSLLPSCLQKPETWNETECCCRVPGARSPPDQSRGASTQNRSSLPSVSNPHPAVTLVLAQISALLPTRGHRMDFSPLTFDLKSNEMMEDLRLFGVTLFFSAETSQDESALC